MNNHDGIWNSGKFSKGEIVTEYLSLPKEDLRGQKVARATGFAAVAHGLIFFNFFGYFGATQVPLLTWFQSVWKYLC